MKLDRLIDWVNAGYPDDLVMQNYNFKTHKPYTKIYGDGLAHFIVVEICDTYDRNASIAEQKEEALRVMRTASRELTELVDYMEQSCTLS